MKTDLVRSRLAKRTRSRASPPGRGGEPEAAVPVRDDLIEGGRRWFGPFFAIFGSVATASAILLFTGFLSDFAAYQMLGLPRLSFNLTSAAEVGAEVLVDIAALLVSGLRVWLLVLLVLLVTAVWARHDHPIFVRLTRSVTVYRLSRIGLLALSFLLFASMAERANRTLNGMDAEPDVVAQALQDAYADAGHFPTPDERLIAIERPTYALKWMRPINQLAPVELAWKRFQDCRARAGWLAALSGRCGRNGVSTSAAFEPVSGFMLRTMPESRFMARQTLGWWAMLTLFALVAHLLIGWWGQSLSDLGDVLPGTTAGEADGGAGRAWAFVRGLMGGKAIESSNEGPLHRFVVPLTTLTLMLCSVLLPLGHGMLAKSSIGGETVAVFLKAPTSGVTAKMAKAATAEARPQGSSDSAALEGQALEGVPVLYPEPSTDGYRSWPAGRFDCPVGSPRGRIPDQADGESVEKYLLDLRVSVNGATRDLVQNRDVDEVKGNYERTVVALAEGVIAQNCAERVRDFWAERPPSGLVAQLPEIGEIFRRHLLRVTVAYGLRLGTILNYPRAGQPLSLADSIVPRGATKGVWSVRSVTDQEAGEVVVLPDMTRSEVVMLQQVLRGTPDDESALAALLVSPNPQALDALIQFVDQGVLFSNGHGVAITALGGAAWSSTTERPDLSREAIDLLIKVSGGTSGTSAAALGTLSDDVRLRGSAVTALHLSRSPYAAKRFADLLVAEGAAIRKHWGKPLDCSTAPKSGQLTPIRCIATATTAAGYLARDLGVEIDRIVLGQPICRGDRAENDRRRCGDAIASPPPSLLHARDRLIDFLLRVVTAPDVEDSVRGAACTGLQLSGARQLDAEQRKVFLENITSSDSNRFTLSTPACISQMSYLGMNGPLERTLLKEVALGTHPLVSGTDEEGALMLRKTALTSLYELGISHEVDLFMELYLADRQGDMSEFVQQFLDQLDTPHLAESLIACAEDVGKDDDMRARCIEGLGRMHLSYDGDGGGTRRLYALLADERDPFLRDALCKGLGKFGQRGSNWVARRVDTLQRECNRTVDRPDKKGENEAERFRKELERLMKQL